MPENTITLTNSLPLILEELIAKKSTRDGINFNCSQLAAALEMPRSIITRLIHRDPTKRVTNPRIDTLIKIANYFRADGFDITINDLLGIKQNFIDVQEQNSKIIAFQQTIPIYTLNARRLKKIKIAEVTLSTLTPNAIGFSIETDITPIFKKGSIFVVDTEMKPENNALIAIKIDKIQIKKIMFDGDRWLLQHLNQQDTSLVLTKEMYRQIIGVVIQVNVKI